VLHREDAVKALARRLGRIEAVARLTRESDFDLELQRLALQQLSTEDLKALRDLAKHGRQELERSERDSKAIRALAGAFEDQVSGGGKK
jgi:hypothetical protein